LFDKLSHEKHKNSLVLASIDRDSFMASEATDS